MRDTKQDFQGWITYDFFRHMNLLDPPPHIEGDPEEYIAVYFDGVRFTYEYASLFGETDARQT